MALLLGLVCGPTCAQVTITTVAGNGSTASSGDGGQAVAAGFNGLSDIARDGAGNLFIVDVGSYRIRKVTPDGVISNYAGTGQPVFASDTETNVGDGGQATAAAISPTVVAADAAGNVYFFDERHRRVRKITPAGIISTLAGRSEFGITGDGGPATQARLAHVRGIAVDSGDNVVISDTAFLRKISTGGIITRIAGGGGVLGDGGPASLAYLDTPRGLAFDAADNLFVADSGAGRVRRITTAGIISTVMGGGAWSYDFFATRVSLGTPLDVAADSKGYVYASSGPTWIRKVSPGGLLANAGGFRCPNDGCGYSAIPPAMLDGGDAYQAYLTGDYGLVVEPGDSLLTIDHNRVRRLSASPAAQAPVAADVLKPYVAYPVNSMVTGVTVGDFDGDGRKDVLAATGAAPPGQEDGFSLLLYRQQADGSLGTPVKSSWSAPVDGWNLALAMADFNHDGRQDVVLSRPQGLTLFLGNAGGNLVPQAIDVAKMCACGFGYSLLATDTDQDGHVDIVASQRHNDIIHSGLWTLRGVGNGSFQTATFQAYGDLFSTEAVNRLMAADMDNDGDDDLLATGRANNQTRTHVLLQQGGGVFAPGPSFPAQVPFGSAGAAAAGDADDDGRDDLVQQSAALLLVHRQDANARFDAPRRFGVERQGDVVILHDMNKDGRQDVLGLELGLAVSYFERTATGYEAVRKYELPQGNFAGQYGMAIGALDADGCDDVAVAGESQGLLVFRGQNCAPSNARADVDADGREELAWKDRDGGVSLWPGGQRSAALALRPGVGWDPVALDDFDGDGRAQLLWRHCVSGALLRSPALQGAAAAAPIDGPGRDWTLAASGDFDGDGRADLLWQHASGLTERWPGGAPAARQRGASLARGWAVVASGDFDGDGRADLFWRHAPTGANLIWRAGGLAGAQRVTAITDRDWQVVGSGDTDGDGRDDVVWRHRRDGRNALWPAASYAARRTLAPLADPGWTVAAVADVDGDRRADLRWVHASGLGLSWKRADAALASAASPVPRGTRAVGTATSACAGQLRDARASGLLPSPRMGASRRP